MKINDIYESTTAGAIASVSAPMTTQKRSGVGKGVYGNEKAGTLLTGKKTNKKYANSVNESKMKELAMDLKDMDNGNFQKKYKKSKEQIKFELGDPEQKKTVHEATLEEDDLILVPGQGHRLKSGFIPHDQDRRDHEVEMAKSDLFQAAKNAKQVYELIHDVTEDEGLEGWVQEKIIKANDYLNTIREYLEGKQLQSEMGVIAGGAGNFEEAADPIARRITVKKWGGDDKYSWAVLVDGRPAVTGLGKNEVPYYKNMIMKKLQEKPHLTGTNLEEGKGLWANIHAKRERIKKGSGERMRKPGSKGAPSAQDFKDAAKEGVGEKIKGAIRREKAKDLPLVQTRRDYAMGKAGQAYEKGDTRKGNQYSAYAEKDRKKKGDPTTNPAGTYRTKTSDYTNEGALVDNLYKVRYKNTETGETKDIKIRAPSSKEAREQAESDYTHDSRVWKCLGTKEITNEAQSMGTALKNTLAKAEPGSKLDNSIKSHNRHIKAGLPGTLKNAPTGYHFDSKGYCRLGDK